MSTILLMRQYKKVNFNNFQIKSEVKLSGYRIQAK
jgi:hypothetical protein